MPFRNRVSWPPRDRTSGRRLARLILDVPVGHTSQVFTIRCTQALLKRLQAPLDATDESDENETTTVLGDWYANTLNVGRQRFLLCSSERSLLTVVIPAAPLSAFPERLAQAVGRRLTALAIAAPSVEREQRDMRGHRFGRTRSRQVLGSMNDFAFLAEHYIRDDGPDFDLNRIEQMLNRAPCRPIQYQSPDRLTPALFARAS